MTVNTGISQKFKWVSFFQRNTCNIKKIEMETTSIMNIKYERENT
jgi:predicted fused transcriptional regulator/phosphomethylpyrimidine kinase